MTIKIVSDIHGEYGALESQLEPDDTAVMLGDYINLIDFSTLEGILAQVYTREEIVLALTELAKGNKELARRTIREISGGDDERHRMVRELIIASYGELFRSLPCRAYMLYGNIDHPGTMRDMAPENVRVMDGEVAELDGERFGFVSGSPELPWSVGLPGEQELEEFDRKIERLGPVDVLCSHVPPAVDGITFDVVANRDEVGSRKLRWYVEEYQPRICYFGHVHNPRMNRGRLGDTVLVNAGFFRRHKKILPHSRD